MGQPTAAVLPGYSAEFTPFFCLNATDIILSLYIRYIDILSSLDFLLIFIRNIGRPLSARPNPHPPSLSPLPGRLGCSTHHMKAVNDKMHQLLGYDPRMTERNLKLLRFLCPV